MQVFIMVLVLKGTQEMGERLTTASLVTMFSGLQEPMKCLFSLLIRAELLIYLTDKEKVYTYSITSVENTLEA